MLRKIFISLICVVLMSYGSSAYSAPKSFIVEGHVVEADTGIPVVGAVVRIGSDYLWTTTDIHGYFFFDHVQKGDWSLEVSCLGYVSQVMGIRVVGDVSDVKVSLYENSLALDEVVVTAQRSKDGLGTTQNIGRDALNHLQISNTTDIASLLPGGKTVNSDLTSENTFSLREGGASSGNAAFGTAVEVDGVRIGNNASFGEMSGVDTRGIAVENIESIEVITGVPSAEYGDLNAGMIKINTRKGRTPVNITYSVNPRTYQTSVSKGIDLMDDNGVLNVSAEWAKAVKKPVSPYESYTRTGITAHYSNTFARSLRLEAGVSGNLGGMNTEDDPDAFTGEYEHDRNNMIRGNFALTWMLNKPWVTNLKLDASASYVDNLSHYHKYESYASNQPAVHSEYEGYYLATRLPKSYFSDMMIDSKEVDYAASLKYNWHKSWDGIKSILKAGIQWKSSGNVGQGEYYLDPSLASNGYRPRPYTDYPFMHNLSIYAEEHYTMPVKDTKLEVTAGMRLENVFIRNSMYNAKMTLSPRFNAKWHLTDNISIRAGWGITEKLPSYYILYPRQEYRDIQTYGFSHGDQSSYVYYTQPYTITYNPNLRWQRNSNSELGFDLDYRDVKVSLVAFYNVTMGPYNIMNIYEPYSYDIITTSEDYQIPDNPQIKVDSQTGMVYMRGDKEDYWTPMEVKVTDHTFARTTMQNNSANVRRGGTELIVDFPEIEPIRTTLRLDASYAYTKYINEQLYAYYQNGWSHSSLKDRSYEYVGIYANAGGSSVANGKVTHNMDANLTAITHIPQARLVITCRLEVSLLRRNRNLSRYAGEEYAYTVNQNDNTPTGNDIYGGDSYTAIRPVSYMDLDGNIYPFTDVEAADPAFARLILKSANVYTFARDGYGPFMSANLSITKEIGDHVSMSFFANNFTNSRPYVKSMATGVSAVFTPDFYYGLTCRLKF